MYHCGSPAEVGGRRLSVCGQKVYVLSAQFTCEPKLPLKQSINNDQKAEEKSAALSRASVLDQCRSV